MRFIFGVCLTIGIAYVADSMVSANSGEQPGGRHMVNWDVVSGNLQGASAGVRDAWARLLGQAKELDKKTGT